MTQIFYVNSNLIFIINVLVYLLFYRQRWLQTRHDAQSHWHRTTLRVRRHRLNRQRPNTGPSFAQRKPCPTPALLFTIRTMPKIRLPRFSIEENSLLALIWVWSWFDPQRLHIFFLIRKFFCIFVFIGLVIIYKKKILFFLNMVLLSLLSRLSKYHCSIYHIKILKYSN